MIKIFLVDDHPIVRQGLRQLIAQESDLSVCGEAEDLQGALRKIADIKPDIVIADVSLQQGDGIDLIKRVHGLRPNIRTLVLSMHEELFIVERALRAGASGYLPKQEVSDEILTAIRRILKGEIYVSERLSSKLMKNLLTGKPGEGEDSVSRLSEREFQVFQLIGQGKSPQEIAEALCLSVKTIDTHREHIKEKLGLKDFRQLMQYAIRWTITRNRS